jgi:hypothetical protein
MIVVAVPTKYKLAFSLPAPVGCTFASFALGSDEGNSVKVRVGAADPRGSIVSCFIGRINLDTLVS